MILLFLNIIIKTLLGLRREMGGPKDYVPKGGWGGDFICDVS